MAGGQRPRIIMFRSGLKVWPGAISWGIEDAHFQIRFQSLTLSLHLMSHVSLSHPSILIPYAWTHPLAFKRESAMPKSKKSRLARKSFWEVVSLVVCHLLFLTRNQLNCSLFLLHSHWWCDVIGFDFPLSSAILCFGPTRSLVSFAEYSCLMMASSSDHWTAWLFPHVVRIVDGSFHFLLTSKPFSPHVTIRSIWRIKWWRFH